MITFIAATAALCAAGLLILILVGIFYLGVISLIEKL